MEIKMRIGIDVGGTHTDITILNTVGEIQSVGKARTTKEDITKAILELIKENSGGQIDTVEVIVNGTTVGLNAILEKKYPELALITTKGFRDILLIRRETKAEINNYQWDKPLPLIPRRNIFEITERVDYNGEIFKKINENEARELVRKIKNLGFNRIAVVLLHSYVNPTHENILKRIILEEIEDAQVTISSEILPEWREFERTYNTVLAAILKPVMENYSINLAGKLNEMGFHGDLEIMQANASVASIENILVNPVSTLFSGPAAGVVGGTISAKTKHDKGNIITFDMGGTSTDICLVTNGVFSITYENQLEWEGLLRYPSIDVHSVGAGGGSIAWVDDVNGFHVGPQSAGAFPGPACYGFGGEDATVTDANLVLGYLNENNYLGGKYILSYLKSFSAIENIAKKLNLDIIECALGIRRIINSNMVYGIRHVSIERGKDPREYSLVAFGGAGPLHAGDIIDQLEMKRAIIPLYPGNVSSIGLLGAEPKVDLVKTKYIIIDNVDPKEIENIFKIMEKEAIKRLERTGVKKSEVKICRSLDMRYTGQTHEINVENIPLDLSHITKEEIKERFHQKHKELYSYFNMYEPIAIVNLRISVVGPERFVGLGLKSENFIKDPSEIRKSREAYFLKNDEIIKILTPVYDRYLLPCGFNISGPVILEEDLATTIVPIGYSLRVLSSGCLEISKNRSK
jgi:N-methylhydantoinase A